MNKVSIIGMPMKYGCYVDGADLAYDKLYNSLDKIFNNKNMHKIDNSYNSPKEHLGDKLIKYFEPVMEINKRLHDKVLEEHENNNFPLVIGGDHSTAIGSVSAGLDYYKGDVSVIWIDAHTDIHNDKTTPSGNIHGMPLSVLIGRCSDKFNVSSYKLNPTNIFYIGLRNYEIEEINYVNENKIIHYADFEVEEKGIENIVNEIISKIKTKYVHISFDFDVLSDNEFHAVNVGIENYYQSEGGLSLNDSINILELLLNKLNVCSMDIVEYNPLLDNNNECLNKAERVLSKVDECLKYDNSK